MTQNEQKQVTAMRDPCLALPKTSTYQIEPNKCSSTQLEPSFTISALIACDHVMSSLSRDQTSGRLGEPIEIAVYTQRECVQAGQGMHARDIQFHISIP